MSLHAVALEDFEDTFPAGHERQLVCPLAGWYLPLGQYVLVKAPVPLT